MGLHHNAGRSIEPDLNGKPTRDPAEVAVALNRHFVDSVATIAKSFSTVHVKCMLNKHTGASLQYSHCLRNKNHRYCSISQTLKSKRCFWYGLNHAQRYQFIIEQYHKAVSECMEICNCHANFQIR